MDAIRRTYAALVLCVCASMFNAHADTTQPSDPTLRLPEVAALQGAELDPEKVPATGLNITVQGVDNDNAVVLAFQTTLTIYLADAQGQAITTISWPISARNAGKPVTLPIEKRYVDANVGKTLQVYYTAQAPRSAPRRSGVVTLLIKEGFTAAQALNLASRRYVVFFDEHNLARTPPTIPDYARYTRAQPGATAYRVDNTGIARVDPDGQVSVWGNGDITVTAQNAAGASSSYVLSVRGVRELRLLSSAYRSTWAQAQAKARDEGYTLPSDEDFEALARLYPSPANSLAEALNLAPYRVWGKGLGAQTAVYLDLYDNLVSSEVTTEYELGYPAGIR